MKSFKTYVEATYRVEVDGLPPMFIDAGAPGEVKANLRKMLKKPDDIKSVDRVTPTDVKKHFRMKAAGKEEEMTEEAPVNATGPAVDMNPTGKPKKYNDGRSKYSTEKMFRRASGV